MEFRIRSGGAVHEQSNGLESLYRFIRSLSLMRQRKRRHAINRFTTDAKRLATAGNDLDVWCIVQKFIRKLGAGFDEMFTVIKNEQKIFCAQIIENNGRQRHSGLGTQTQYRCDGL